MWVSRTVFARHAKRPELKTFANNYVEMESKYSPRISPLIGCTVPMISPAIVYIIEEERCHPKGSERDEDMGGVGVGKGKEGKDIIVLQIKTLKTVKRRQSKTAVSQNLHLDVITTFV